MTDLRDAARQALELLKELQGGCTDSDDGTVEALTVWCPEVIENLEAALEQPEQATGKESLQVGQEEPEGGWQSAPSPQVTQRIADMPMSEYRRGVNDGFKLGLREGRIKAEDEMREQPEQPVAWLESPYGSIRMNTTMRFQFPPQSLKWKIPLYTHPPQRKPLTDEEILLDEVLRYHFGCNGGAGPVSQKGIKIIRAIERAHGIGGEA
jgi:hypothetical protein